MNSFKACCLVLASIALLSNISCDSNYATKGRDISNNYSTQLKKPLGMDIQLNSKSDGLVTARLRFPQSKLVFENGTAKISIHYGLFTSYSTTEPSDSNRIVTEIDYTGSEYSEVDFSFKVTPGRGYILEVSVRDPSSGKSEKRVIDLIDPKKFSRQSFNVSTFNGQIIYEPYVNGADSYLITSVEDHATLFTQFYDREFPVAKPPFSTTNPKPFDFNPDKTVRLKMVDNRHTVMYITQPGFYHVVMREEDQQGGSVHYFGNHYPESKTINDLLYPLRYITTNEEYEDLGKTNNLKKGIDAFWLKVGGDQTRARKLIQNYYSRVQESNTYFTSYIEGWKSDRGMCYIVFGSPTNVVRSTSKEIWTYGQPGDFNAMRLEFIKVVNPFSQNDFRLVRNATLKTPWYRAVDLWRQGRITTF